MALLILDEKCLVLHLENFSLSCKQTQHAIIQDKWHHLQLIQPNWLEFMMYDFDGF